MEQGVELVSPRLVRSNGAELQWTPYAGTAPFDRYEVHRSMSGLFTPSADTLLTIIRDRATTTWHDTTAGPARQFWYKVVTNGIASGAEPVSTTAPGQARLSLQPGSATGKSTYIAQDLTSPVGCVNWQNHGGSAGLSVGALGGGTVRRSLLRFDLGDIPVHATVQEAKLELSYDIRPDPGQVNVHRMTKEWHEGRSAEGYCDGSGTSWIETQAGARWKAAGGDFDPVPDASVAGYMYEGPGTDSFDLRGLVQEWAKGAAPNHGVLLKAASEAIPPHDPDLTYHSDDAPDQAPKLTVTFADGNQARGPTAAITAPAQGAALEPGTTTLRATAGDDSRVAKVEFRVDGSLAATDQTAPYEVPATLSAGAHRFSVVATDDAGNTTSSAEVTATATPNTAPAVQFPYLDDGDVVSGEQLLKVSSTSDAAKVAYFVDGVLVDEQLPTAAEAPVPILVEGEWASQDPRTGWVNGPHVISAQAFDAQGRAGPETTVNVVLDNDPADGYRASFALNDPATAEDDVFPEVMAENTAPEAPVQDPYAGTADPETGISGGSLDHSLTDAPTQPALAPRRSAEACPLDAYCPTVHVTNDSTTSWSGNSIKLWYRWYADNGAVLLEGPADTDLPASFAPGQTASLPMTIQPPRLPPGAERGRFNLRVDLFDRGTGTWASTKGTGGLQTRVRVGRDEGDRLGLERFWQYDAEALGAGMSSLTNVANGNTLLRWSPFFSPGRGLSTMVDLTYNSLEDHSKSPAGNNFSLSMSGLIRFGEPLDIHPNKADQICGKSRKWVEFVDGDGTLHHFTGTTGTDGITRWAEPPGVNLYLRSQPGATPDRRWALTRPDKVTFYFDEGGFPTAVVDRNGNTISYGLEHTPPGEDPGGPKKRIVRVTDPGGRSFTIDYYSKAEAKKAHVRGKVQRILDHSGSALDFQYYEDGNLLRLIQRGGSKATGEYLPDRSFVFTYTTPSGSGPAISDPAKRVNPDPRTRSQSNRVFSVRDPRGSETKFDYYGPAEGHGLRWRLQSRTNRLGHTTSYGYNLSDTTVSAPLSRTTRYTHDSDGKVTRFVNPIGEQTAVDWSPDFKVTKVTEPTGKISSYSYNPNGYPTQQTNQLGHRTELTYLDEPVDAFDTGRHLSSLTAVTSPRGVVSPAIGDFQWRYEYDAARNPVRVTDPTGAANRYEYHPDGTFARVFDANGNQPTQFPAYHVSGQPTRVVDPTGAVTQFGYDADGLLRWIQDPNHTADSGVDERSYRSFLDYDAFHRLGRQSAPKSTGLDRGRLIWSSVDFDANDNIIRRVDPHYGRAFDAGTAGPFGTAAYDVMDQVLVESNSDREGGDPQGERTAYSYDAAGRIASTTAPKGVVTTAVADDHTTRYEYDRVDRLIRQSEHGVSASDVRRTHLCYDLAGDLRSVTSPRANLVSVGCPASVAFTARFDYDAAHRLVASHDPLGHQVRTAYDENSNVTRSERDIAPGRIARSDVEYDARDMPTRTRERFDGAREVVTVIGYDPNGNLTRLVSPRGFDAARGSGTYQNYVTELSYDGANRPTKVTLPFDGRDSERHHQHRAYDGNGNLTWASLPVATADPALVRDTARRVLTYFDPGWIRTADEAGDTPKVSFDYHAPGWQHTRTPERVSGDARPMEWTYFNDGQLRQRKDQGGHPATYTYDVNNNLVKALDAAGVVDPNQTPVEVEASYTGFDEPAKVRHRRQNEANWKFTSYGYDPNGNVVLRLDNGEEDTPGAQTKAPRRHELRYDAADWLSEQLDLGADGACKDDQRIVNAFWPTGWERQRDLHRADAGCSGDPSTWPRKQTSTWEHFDNGLPRKLATTNGSGEVTESHEVGYLDGNGFYANGHRTSDQHLLKRAEGNNATTCVGANPCTAKHDYDARDRVVRFEPRAGRFVDYRFDEPDKLLDDNSIRAGNVTTESSNTGQVVRRYKANQLSEITISQSTGKYWYDELGNLDCVTLAAGSRDDCARADGGGVSPNLVTDYAYDYLNRLEVIRTFENGTSVTDKAVYTYDALDRTTSEIEDHRNAGKSRTTSFTHEGLTNLVTEEKQSGGTAPKTKSFSYDAYGNRVAMTDKDNASGAQQTYTYATDVHGSVSQLLDDAGKVKASYGYDAYGGSDEVLSTGDTDKQAPINPYRYTGRRMDSGTTTSISTPLPPVGESGYDMGARRYGPDLGRFLQQDLFYGALSDLGLALDPLTQNRYALAGGNPISYVETDGHMPARDGTGGARKPKPRKPKQGSRPQPRVGDTPADFGKDPTPQRRATPRVGDTPADFGKDPTPQRRAEPRVSDAPRDTPEDYGKDPRSDVVGHGVEATGGAIQGGEQARSRAIQANRGLQVSKDPEKRREARRWARQARRSPSSSAISRVAASPGGRFAGRVSGALGAWMSYQEHRGEGDNVVDAGAKTAIESGASTGGAAGGAAVGCALGGPPGCIAGGILGGVGANEVAKRTSDDVLDAVGGLVPDGIPRPGMP